MRGKLRLVLCAACIGLIPAAVALYELFFAPAAAGRTVIPAHLWFSLCTLTPALLPLLSQLETHHWMGDFDFGALLLLSNALLYGLCGLALSFLFRKSAGVAALKAPHVRLNH